MLFTLLIPALSSALEMISPIKLKSFTLTVTVLETSKPANSCFGFLRKYLYLGRTLTEPEVTASSSLTTVKTKEVKSFVKKNLGVKENKLVIIENGVYLEKIYEAIPYKKSEIGLNESDILILMSARFEAQKDHETIIKSLELLPEEFKLLLAG